MMPVRLLIVEDDPFLAELLSLTFEPSVASVALARTLQQAKQSLRDDPRINVILLDLVLPDSPKEDTLAAIRELKRIGITDPMVIVMTAFADSDTAAIASEIGADAFVEKFMARDVCNHIKREMAARGVRLEFSKTVIRRMIAVGW